MIGTMLMFTFLGMILMSALGGSAAAATEFERIEITNSVGTKVTFDEPAQKAASLGISFTTTLLELGCEDCIIMIDSYSAPENSGIAELESIPSYPIYNNGQQIAQILADGEGGFDKNRDVVFVYGYLYHENDIRSLEQLGLKVVTFYPETYEAGMEMVTDIGAIMGQNEKAAEITDSMQSAADYYSEMLATTRISPDSKTKAIYASYSGTNLRVGNANSYSVILMKMAGGINSADDLNKTGGALVAYETDNTIFMQLDFDVIFLDPYYAKTPSEFRSENHISDDVKIYKLDVLMNQYGPTSRDGIEFMAKAMYPEIFGSLEEEKNEGGHDNYWVYIAITAVIVIAAAAAYLIFKQKNSAP